MLPGFSDIANAIIEMALTRHSMKTRSHYDIKILLSVFKKEVFRK